MRTVFFGADGAWCLSADAALPTGPLAQADWGAAVAGSDVRVVLSGRLTHQLVVSDPSLPLDDADSVLAWARHQFVHFHGAAAEGWGLAAWHLDGQRGVSAAHGIDMQALRQQAAEQKIRLRGVLPWWSVALPLAADAAPALATARHGELWIVEGTHVTRLVCAAGRLADIQQHWLDRADLYALAGLIEELRPDAGPWLMGFGIGEDAGPLEAFRLLAPLDGPAPSARWLGC
jgi:hypothetical protein